MSPFSFQNIPEQTGRTAIVTGANTGIGYETARALARKGAHVILACRSREKGAAAVERIRSEAPTGTVDLALLDLADLESVTRFADAFAAAHQSLDLLINNAGVMVPPFGRTKQGFETQFGTNHLGHFALTLRLLPLLGATPGSRVVVVSSGAHHSGRIDFKDPNFERRGYSAWGAYCQSKLANLLFALELDRRLRGAGVRTVVTAAHPGATATDLQRTSRLSRFLIVVLSAMKPEDGALPTLRAATDPGAAAASYWGPAGHLELTGPPEPARISRKARDEAAAVRLWSLSEELTGVRFAALATPAPTAAWRAPAAATSSGSAGA